MIEVNIFDLEFIHTEGMLGYITSSDTRKPTKIKWLNGLMEYDGITVFTDKFVDSDIIEKVKCKTKIYWLMESKAINTIYYEKIKDNEHRFDYILTHDEELLNRGNKYIKSLVGSSRVLDEEANIYPKSKLFSMIASNKRMTIGHNFRHDIINQLRHKYNIDLYGTGYKIFDNKLEPLKDYCYSISVMNIKNNNFFTEVLVDNFRLGTVPIFWGCDNIGDYFDINGIITFNTIEELDDILKNLSFETYNKKMEYIKNNFLISENYLSTDDLIANVLTNIKYD